MRWWTAFLTFGVVALVLSTQVVAKDDPKDKDKANKEVRDKLNGTWKMDKWEIDGVQQPQEDVKKWKMKHNGEELVLEFEGKVWAKGKHTIDGTQKPVQEEFTFTEGPPDQKGKTYIGILEVKGDDYQTCFTEKKDKAERPKEFKTKEKSGQILVQWKREK